MRSVVRQPGRFPVTVESLERRELLSAVTATKLAASVNPAVFGQSITLTAIVTSATGNPGGNVTFKDGSTVLGTGAINSTTHRAIFATAKLSVTTHNLIAVYGGTSAFAGSSSATLKETVNPDATKTTLAASSTAPVLGQSVTLTATVTAAAPGSGQPKGTVQFKLGTTVLGSAALDTSGHAVFKTYTLSLGSHPIVAAYTGGPAFKASASFAANVVVKQPTLTTKADGLKFATVTAGSGPGAVVYQYLKVEYTGYLTNGVKFDSSLNAGRTPLSFQLGVGQVIDGWDEGLVGAKVGETRVLVIPPALGYGSTANGSIPANSTLIFIVKVLQFVTTPKLVLVGNGNTVIPNNGAPSLAAGTNFGSVKTGAASATLVLLLANTGNAPLQPTASPPVLIAGANAADFVIVQPVVQNGQILFGITFKPKALGTRTAKLTIRTNDPLTPNFTFSVSGVGT